MITLEQKVFLTVLKTARKLYNESVYDGQLPPEGTDYPFIYVGYQSSSELTTKSHYGSDVSQRISFYTDNLNKRGTLSEMVNNLISELRKENVIQISDNTTFIDENGILITNLTLRFKIY